MTKTVLTMLDMLDMLDVCCALCHHAGTRDSKRKHIVTNFFLYWFDLKSHHIDKIAEEKRFDRVDTHKKNEEQ